jgi:AraC-like DNA-binding protein
MKREPTVSALNLSFELAAFESLGLDVNRILARAELSRERVMNPQARIALGDYLRWWRSALDVSGDPALGLRVGATLRAGALGSFEYMLRHTESLEQLLVRANEYMRLVDDTTVLDLRREHGRAILRVYRRGGYPMAPPEVHTLFSAIVILGRDELPAARLLAVRFAHAAPVDASVFERHFGCPVRFEQEHDEVEFDAALLALAPRGADGKLGRVLEEHARHLLAELPEEAPLLVSARTALREQIERGAPSAHALAKVLRMSERTLRRRLEAEGTSYQALLDETRSDLARAWVGTTREGFQTIAYRLAFADASTFFRAFKRWTGTTPARFRERAKGGG